MTTTITPTDNGNNENKYFKGLFDTFNNYLKGGSVSDSLTTADKAIYSSFTASDDQGDGQFINLAGNYKYSCILPIDSTQPPNYIGVLKENDALNGSFIDELLSFIDPELQGDNPSRINCTRAARELYSEGYRPYNAGTENANEDTLKTYLINFTHGMPYDIRERALRIIHKDLVKQLNEIIDYAIAKGYDDHTDTNAYTDVFVNNFLNMFFDKDGKPRYYALRTGILPSAISYMQYLTEKNDNTSNKTFNDLYNHYKNDIDYLEEKRHFIPIGRSAQFLNSQEEKLCLYWYPFCTNRPYSYKYDVTGNTSDDHKYVVDSGFNHYHVTGDEGLKEKFKTILNSTVVETDEINSKLAGITAKDTILSYESCLTDIKSPKTITVTDLYDTYDTDKENNLKCRYGSETKPITSIDKWATASGKDNDLSSIHPLLNIDGREKQYLNVIAQQNANITDDIELKESDNKEEIYYYNNGFTFTTGERALERLNYYNTDENDNRLEKSVDVYSLEFGKVSRDLYKVTNNATELKIDTSYCVANDVWGLLAKLPNSITTTKTENDKTVTTTSSVAWQTISCGITGVYDDVEKDGEWCQNVKENGLFTITDVNDERFGVPQIDMNITTLRYNNPYKEGSHGCYYYRGNAIWNGITCHAVPYLENGTDYYEGSNGKTKASDFGERLVEVKFDKKYAILGKYNPNVVYNMCKMTLDQKTVYGYYYTIHILADDGEVKKPFSIDFHNGHPNFGSDVDNNRIKNEIFKATESGEDLDKTTSKDERLRRYGTGVQYFFGGKCNKGIFDDYWNRGLTLFQLLNPDPKNDAYMDEPGKRYGKIINGLHIANKTFEWNYDLINEAWRLAYWIMRNFPAGDKRGEYDEDDAKKILYNTDNAALALAAFFDHIYLNGVDPENTDTKTTDKEHVEPISLLLGRSLKQINNKVGPYGSSDNTKGVTDPYDNTTLTGAAWDAVNGDTDHNGAVFNSLNNHSKAAAAIYVNNEQKVFTESKYDNMEVGATERCESSIWNKKACEIEKRSNGVGRKYWSKGDTSGTKKGQKDDNISNWGVHLAYMDKWTYAGAPTGYLHLDHYSWGWHMRDDDNGASQNAMFDDPKPDYHLWQGAFMIHALQHGTHGYNAPFNWHLGPFHEVSPEAQKHTNEYGTRDKLVHFTEKNDDGSCTAGIRNDKEGYDDYRQGWDGINDETYDNQNPNIRIRLPMLWRYLSALREKRIYTDGQLMPCGIELHYCTYRKALMTSISGAEQMVPIDTDAKPLPEGAQLTQEEIDSTDSNSVTNLNLNNWRRSITSSSSMVFAEVLHNTYAITQNTIKAWRKALRDNGRDLIKEILSTIQPHKDILTAMFRAKRYIDTLPKEFKEKGKTLFNIPVLPTVSLFGATNPIEKDDKNKETTLAGETAEETPTSTNDESTAEETTTEVLSKDSTQFSTIMKSDMKMLYNTDPIYDFKNRKLTKMGVGITMPPELQGDKPNQFSDIAKNIYTSMAKFDGDTIGWIVPVPTAPSLTLLDAFDDSWRNNEDAVIALTNKNLRMKVENLRKNHVHWIGWIISDAVSCVSTSDLSNDIHIHNEGDANDDVIIPMVTMRISPYYNHSEIKVENKSSMEIGNAKCNDDGTKCTQTARDESLETECNNLKAKLFSVKLDIDTRSTGESLKLIMISDMIKDEGDNTKQYSIYNIKNDVTITDKEGNNRKLNTFMTTVAYDKNTIDIPDALNPLEKQQ